MDEGTYPMGLGYRFQGDNTDTLMVDFPYVLVNPFLTSQLPLTVYSGSLGH